MGKGADNLQFSVLSLHRITERLFWQGQRIMNNKGGLGINAIGRHRVGDTGPCVLRLKGCVSHVKY
jgi:hypothetical protein